MQFPLVCIIAEKNDFCKFNKHGFTNYFRGQTLKLCASKTAVCKNLTNSKAVSLYPQTGRWRLVSLPAFNA